jgi:hypothetical protein
MWKQGLFVLTLVSFGLHVVAGCCVHSGVSCPSLDSLTTLGPIEARLQVGSQDKPRGNDSHEDRCSFLNDEEESIRIEWKRSFLSSIRVYPGEVSTSRKDLNRNREANLHHGSLRLHGYLSVWLA